MIGRVVSVKQMGTAIVLVSSTKTHPLYKKSFARNKRYAVDNLLDLNIGDLVEFIKVKPISKNKHWRIIQVLGRDIAEVVSEQLKERAQETIEEVMPEEKV